MARTDQLALVGFGLLLALPGAPVFLYGDEIGLTGTGSELSRRPMPWARAGWDRRFLDAYRDLVRLRRRLPALHHGGFRWVHVGPDAVVFLREAAGERIMVRAARAPTPPLALPTAWLGATEAEPLYGADHLSPTAGTSPSPGTSRRTGTSRGADTSRGRGAYSSRGRGADLVVAGDGPAFSLWRLR
jgi:hypothetical protein